MEPFKSLEDAQRFLEERAYEHFRAAGMWPRTRDFDLEYYELLDPLGGLQLVCRRVGHERITCGSTASEHDRIILRWRALMECSAARDDLENFLAAVRLGAERYHAARGGDVALQVSDLVKELKIDEAAAKRVIALMLEGNSITRGGGGGSVSLAHQISRMRGVPTLEEYLARVEADVERRQALARDERGEDRPVPKPPKRIFLSHAAADAALAHHLANVLRQGDDGLQVFVASKAGDIPTGADWLATIEAELDQADTYVLLLTPRSVERLWFWYESGAAWMSERPFIPLTAAGLAKGDVPYPLGAKQTLSLEEPSEVEQLARDLGIAIPDPASFCATVRELSKALPHAAATPFRGVTVDERFFDWEGPFQKLDEWDPVPAPEGLFPALQAAGLEARFTTHPKLRDSLAVGWVRVHQTDRRTWRRDVLMPGHGDQVLLVRARGRG